MDGVGSVWALRDKHEAMLGNQRMIPARYYLWSINKNLNEIRKLTELVRWMILASTLQASSFVAEGHDTARNAHPGRAYVTVCVSAKTFQRTALASRSPQGVKSEAGLCEHPGMLP